MIYIIEDDENIRNLVQVALNGSGYETAAFETAEEALGASFFVTLRQIPKYIS